MITQRFNGWKVAIVGRKQYLLPFKFFDGVDGWEKVPAGADLQLGVFGGNQFALPRSRCSATK